MLLSDTNRTKTCRRRWRRCMGLKRRWHLSTWRTAARRTTNSWGCGMTWTCRRIWSIASSTSFNPWRASRTAAKSTSMTIPFKLLPLTRHPPSHTTLTLSPSFQSATRALKAGADEETVVCALLHDVGELLSPQVPSYPLAVCDIDRGLSEPWRNSSSDTEAFHLPREPLGIRSFSPHYILGLTHPFYLFFCTPWLHRY